MNLREIQIMLNQQCCDSAPKRAESRALGAEAGERRAMDDATRAHGLKYLCEQERTALLLLVAVLAQCVGYSLGQRHAAAYGCQAIYLDLPTGQVSWNLDDRECKTFHWLPRYLKDADGHARETALERIHEFGRIAAEASRWASSARAIADAVRKAFVTDR